MALTVQTNTAAITALKNLNTNSQAMNNSLNRLSSGFRINSAADDASGFAVSSKLDAQTGRLKAASQNATQASAMVKMADAGVNEIQNMVNRIQTLATQAASSNNAGELGKLDAERIKLESAIDKIANGTNYNGINLLNGSGGGTVSVGTGATGVAASATLNGASLGDAYTLTSTTTATGVSLVLKDTAVGGATSSQTVAVTTPSAGTTSLVSFGNIGLSFTVDSSIINFTVQNLVNATGNSNFQVGADNTANNRVTVNLTNSYTTVDLGLGATGKGIDTQVKAQAYMDIAKNALNSLITRRADLGATQNQLSFIQANLATSIEQTTSAVSSIKDADMAMEMANFTKNKILTQAGTSMLAQANQASQNVLTLFR